MIYWIFKILFKYNSAQKAFEKWHNMSDHTQVELRYFIFNI